VQITSRGLPTEMLAGCFRVQPIACNSAHLGRREHILLLQPFLDDPHLLRSID